MLTTEPPTHNDDEEDVSQNPEAGEVQNDVNDKSIDDIDDFVPIFNDSETKTKSEKRFKKRAKKKKLVLKPKKNPTKKSTTPNKKKKTAKKNDYVTKKKWSEGNKFFVEKSTSKNKFVQKRNTVLEVEVVEEDVNKNLDDMLVPLNKKSKKVMGSKKYFDNVPIAPLVNVSFYSEESVLKWKHVYHMIISSERELSKEALKCYEIMELLEDAYFKKIVSGIIPFHPNMVKEFIVNLPKGFNDAWCSEFRKVHIRGHFFGFSPTIVNDYLGRGEDEKQVEKMVNTLVKNWCTNLSSMGTRSNNLLNDEVFIDL
ncbi:unnamed protein product [Vicia faba]|uniref:Uncharacterized protein n=1 Tax=Vicia faba TaxID=3906 RepID=A0AAV0ZWN4_VICFA|nr:unnamed protein product [Vicia faba]